jgi:geranylgeranyl diphosphate synthase type II
MAYTCFDSYEPSTHKKLLTLFNTTAIEVCEGQQLDVDFETRTNVSIVEYIKMITLKTSVLVAAAMKMGAIIANVDEKQSEAIYNFGLNLGIAFQLQDDYLDTFGDFETFGKNIGGDILENKKTFLFLKCIEVANETDKNALLKLYTSKSNDFKKVKDVTNIFIKNNIANYTVQEIEKYTNNAFLALNSLSISDEKKSILESFGVNLMKRTV